MERIISEDMAKYINDRRKYNWYVGKEEKHRTVNVILSNYPSPLQEWHTSYNKKHTYDLIARAVNNFYSTYGFRINIITPYGLGASIEPLMGFISSLFKQLGILLRFILIRMDEYYEGYFLNRRQKIGLTINIPDSVNIQDNLFLHKALRSVLEYEIPYVDFYIDYRILLNGTQIIVDLQNTNNFSICERIIRKVNKISTKKYTLINIRAKKVMFWYVIKHVELS